MLVTGWFIYTQVAVTLCLVTQCFAFGMAFIIWLRTGKTQRDMEKRPRRDPFKAIHVLCGITVASGEHAHDQILSVWLSVCLPVCLAHCLPENIPPAVNENLSEDR